MRDLFVPAQSYLDAEKGAEVFVPGFVYGITHISLRVLGARGVYKMFEAFEVGERKYVRASGQVTYGVCYKLGRLIAEDKCGLALLRERMEKAERQEIRTVDGVQTLVTDDVLNVGDEVSIETVTEEQTEC